MHKSIALGVYKQQPKCKRLHLQQKISFIRFNHLPQQPHFLGYSYLSITYKCS